MSTKHLTGGIIVSVVALLIGYDIWVYIEDTPGDTISEVLLSVALGNPIVPLVCGIVLGHLFWPQRK